MKQLSVCPVCGKRKTKGISHDACHHPNKVKESKRKSKWNEKSMQDFLKLIGE